MVIVSAYGRGAWLAHRLQKEGFGTTVMDVSSLLPALSSEEREGPFGVFLPSHLSDLQKQYLCEDCFYPVPQGFSVFTSQGPLEFQSSLSCFFVETRKDFQLCHSVLSCAPEVNSSNPSHKKRWQKECEESFWLLRLAAELTNSYLGRDFSIEKGIFSPFFSDYVLRESSQCYFADLKYSLQQEGVEWISVSSKREVERSVSRAQEQRDHYLVWTLSGPETAHYFSDCITMLFPGWTEPIKIWRRFSLSWDQGEFKKIIPSLLLVSPDGVQKNGLEKEIHSKELHCESEGVLSLKKNPASSSMDLWMLCPYGERFDRQTLSACLQSALDRLRSLFPHFSIEGSLPEIDFCHSYFVLYENGNTLKEKASYKRLYPHLFHLNPESAGKMDAYSIMQQSHWIWEELLKKHRV